MGDEESPSSVSRQSGAKQGGEAGPTVWGWVEHSVWTPPMLETLQRGVKGGVWFSLIDKVYRRSTLEAAWLHVRANKGKAGSDHQSIGDFEQNLAENLAGLEEALRSGTYRPRPILRIHIPKMGSGEMRPLGIPTVRDRVVQAALKLVIEPIFEREFVAQSYGFRPGLGCKDALREVDRLMRSGYTHVVDADLKAYFDSIPHDRLMQDVRRYISDGRVLGLIEAFLKQDVLSELGQWTPEEGTPQGAVISPLLANLYLHSVDVAMEKAGCRMIRYADDFVILSRDRHGAETALELVQTLMGEKALELHPTKTRIADMTDATEGFEFLGYRFARGTRMPRKKSLSKLRDIIRRKTRRTNGQSLERIIVSVNYTLRGWFEYFKHSNKYTFPRLDKWTRRRLRSILRSRIKLKGISKGHDHYRWPNAFFHAHGLFNLEAAHGALLRPSKR